MMQYTITESQPQNDIEKHAINDSKVPKIWIG